MYFIKKEVINFHAQHFEASSIHYYALLNTPFFNRCFNSFMFKP